MQTSILIPPDLTQGLVSSSPQLSRFQKDLLILTSFPENSSLHRRPSWLQQAPRAKKYWTLQTPPNVVSEYLPHDHLRDAIMTRRMRQVGDPPPRFIKSWEHWKTYCGIYGIPEDFLCEEQVALMRLGLPRDREGTLKSNTAKIPPVPEPQPRNCGLYLLDPSLHINLTRKYERLDDGQVIFIHSSGTLEVKDGDVMRLHPSSWSHFSGTGGYTDGLWLHPSGELKLEGKWRKWSYLPWTEETQETCKPSTIKLRGLRQMREEEEQRDNERNGPQRSLDSEMVPVEELLSADDDVAIEGME
ncbi:hypothetical protein BCR34DRAFT_624800 [Clohesyomyces aquaticus]|uniref:Uncharacterized protein n=1 Tax=Clohesyomyces aquaticus TaxID=1231657 RepID=A0A1Y1ZP04_9PLEO|nr:hypothetical protein BCR34DRAFT_624800 [Clohesyomyces aquaticus]